MFSNFSPGLPVPCYLLDYDHVRGYVLNNFAAFPTRGHAYQYLSQILESNGERILNVYTDNHRTYINFGKIGVSYGQAYRPQTAEDAMNANSLFLYGIPVAPFQLSPSHFQEPLNTYGNHFETNKPNSVRNDEDSKNQENLSIPPIAIDVQKSIEEACEKIEIPVSSPQQQFPTSSTMLNVADTIEAVTSDGKSHTPVIDICSSSLERKPISLPNSNDGKKNNNGTSERINKNNRYTTNHSRKLTTLSGTVKKTAEVLFPNMKEEFPTLGSCEKNTASNEAKTHRKHEVGRGVRDCSKNQLPNRLIFTRQRDETPNCKSNKRGLTQKKEHLVTNKEPLEVKDIEPSTIAKEQEGKKDREKIDDLSKIETTKMFTVLDELSTKKSEEDSEEVIQKSKVVHERDTPSSSSQPKAVKKSSKTNSKKNNHVSVTKIESMTQKNLTCKFHPNSFVILKVGMIIGGKPQSPQFCKECIDEIDHSYAKNWPSNVLELLKQCKKLYFLGQFSQFEKDQTDSFLEMEVVNVPFEQNESFINLYLSGGNHFFVAEINTLGLLKLPCRCSSYSQFRVVGFSMEGGEQSINICIACVLKRKRKLFPEINILVFQVMKFMAEKGIPHLTRQSVSHFLTTEINPEMKFLLACCFNMYLTDGFELHESNRNLKYEEDDDELFMTLSSNNGFGRFLLQVNREVLQNVDLATAKKIYEHYIEQLSKDSINKLLVKALESDWDAIPIRYVHILYMPHDKYFRKMYLTYVLYEYCKNRNIQQPPMKSFNLSLIGLL